MSESFTFDDPNAGKVSKSKFTDYLSELKETVEALREGRHANTFMDLSEVVTQESDGVLTAWAGGPCPAPKSREVG